jgi:hypothetical protein
MWFSICLAIGFPFALWIAWDEQNKAKIARGEAARAYQEANSLRAKTADILRAYKYYSREERYQDIDKMLSSLPDPSRYQAPYYRMMKQEAFEMLSYALTDEPLEPISYSILDFNQSWFHWHGEGRTAAWERNGWLLMPKPSH